MKRSCYLTISITLIAVLVACTSGEKTNIKDVSFIEKQFEIYEQKCGGQSACLMAIKSLRQCYIDSDVYVQPLTPEIDEIENFFEAREDCQKALGLYGIHPPR